MKKNLLFIIVLVTNLTFSQLVKPFVGIGASKHPSFEKGAYFNATTGVEFRAFDFLRPEFALNYYLGYLTQNYVALDKNGNALSIKDVKFNNISLQFSPKLALFKEEDKNYYFQLFPKISFSNIKVEEDFLDLTKTNAVEEIQVIKEWQTNFGAGIGIVVNVLGKNPNSLAFTINYDNIELGNLFNKLKHSNGNTTTRNVLNFCISYYINPNSKK